LPRKEKGCLPRHAADTLVLSMMAYRPLEIPSGGQEHPIVFLFCSNPVVKIELVCMVLTVKAKVKKLEAKETHQLPRSVALLGLA
jgi:hypothetical protein